MGPLDEALSAFRWRGAPLGARRHGMGHINDTYAVTCDSGVPYILQRVNEAVFRKPRELMENIAAVTDFLSRRTDDFRRCLRLIPTRDGDSWFVDSEGGYWRAFPFIPDSVCLQAPTCPEDLYQSGVAFGAFQRQLADFPAAVLHESIPNFHDTPERYRAFRRVLEEDPLGRAAGCGAEIRAYLDREAGADAIVKALADGSLPLRVTHNDTKLNNVMLDDETHEALCVIDLDTIMPGSALYDYGDSIRFGAATAPEDERELDRMGLDLELFRVYTQGFLDACGDSLTERELQMLPEGARLMTLECGLRFLTDHLAGDTYFKIGREGHNLDRARAQLRLVEDMERKRADMERIVREVRG